METPSPNHLHAHLSQHVQPVMADWQQHPQSRLEQVMVQPYTLSRNVGLDYKYRDSSMASSGALSVAGTMASSFRLSSTASDNVPSLTRSSQTRSARSIQTDDMSMASSRTGSAMSVSINRRPLADILQCPFIFIGCQQEFLDKDDWITHALSHFRSHRPPSRAQCPFCEAKWSSSGPDAWAARMEHVATYHRNARLGRPYHADYDLFRHLLNCKAVTYIQYQELERGHWCDVSTDAYTETYDSRRERRRGAPSGWISHRVGPA